jgi:carbon monoxide dehydrogenase subunit G
MDKLLNELTVIRPIEETWKVLTDIERIAPCMPGATLEEIDGDVFRGTVKVKLGAISTAFKGQATFIERDDMNHRAVLKAEGRDTTGKGNANAVITAHLEAVTDATTKVVVETDLHITGKVAQFGRGIMTDVSKKLIDQFATNLNKMLDQQPEETAPTAGNGPDTKAASADTSSGEPEAKHGSRNGETAAETSAIRESGVRKINGPAAAPIELSDVAGSAILKRALPLLGGLVLLLVAVRRLRRR